MSGADDKQVPKDGLCLPSATIGANLASRRMVSLGPSGEFLIQARIWSKPSPVPPCPNSFFVFFSTVLTSLRVKGSKMVSGVSWRNPGDAFSATCGCFYLLILRVSSWIPDAPSTLVSLPSLPLLEIATHLGMLLRG